MDIGVEGHSKQKEQNGKHMPRVSEEQCRASMTRMV